MSEQEINEAILTLDVLIDCTKEDGTYYNAKKEWEALEVFKKLQQENQELNQRINKAQDFIRNESYLNDSEIDELCEILEGDK
jgi:hypothetical protein